MYLFRYFIFVCLFSAVSAQAVASEQQSPVDGYQSAIDVSEFWIPPTEAEGDQPDTLIASNTTNAKLSSYCSTASLCNAVSSANYRHFQSRAPPANQ